MFGLHRSWLDLSLLKPSFHRPRQRPILSQNKAVGERDDYFTTKRFVFCVVVVEFAVNGNEA